VGLTRRLAACLEDDRQPGKVRHQTLELLRQRLFGLACGYADCNDGRRLADDAITSSARARSPRRPGSGVAAHPVAVRDAVGARETDRHGHVPADTVIEHHRAAAQGPRTPHHDRPGSDRRSTHGQQEFTFFNGHYDTWCYLPVVATGDVQRGGRAVCRRRGPATRQCAGQPRGLWPLAASDSAAARGIHAPTIRVRLDGGFATPRVFTFLETESVEYVVGMRATRGWRSAPAA